MALLLAWAAFLLPWEHCACPAHDHVVSALGHECHEHDHHHEHDHEPEEHEEHEDVEFVSLRPGVAKTLGAPAAVTAAPAPALPAARAPARADSSEAPARPPAALRLSVVRLL